MDSDEKSRKSRERGGELGRMAGKLVKNAGPRTKRLIEENRPRVEKAIQDARPKVEKAVQQYRPKVEQAGRDAVRYAQEHPEEIKALALKGARMRLGPLGMAIDALAGPQPDKPPSTQQTCAKCQTVNAPKARFCTECGGQLASGSPSA
jgi:ElaB/YqjD/DUF883 family membrane-anchored ribosome-binding protein